MLILIAPFRPDVSHAITLVSPAETPSGTRNLTVVPEASTIPAATPSTVTRTLRPPNPLPLIVTTSPARAVGVLIASMRAPSDAAHGRAPSPTKRSRQTTGRKREGRVFIIGRPVDVRPLTATDDRRGFADYTDRGRSLTHKEMDVLAKPNTCGPCAKAELSAVAFHL